MSFNVYNELVLETPEAVFDNTRISSNRVGCLFSWNFLPKSWVYVAVNDYREVNDDDPEHRLQLKNLVGAVKVRYLLYI
jgi:hypothetical protein